MLKHVKTIYALNYSISTPLPGHDFEDFFTFIQTGTPYSVTTKVGSWVVLARNHVPG